MLHKDLDVYSSQTLTKIRRGTKLHRFVKGAITYVTPKLHKKYILCIHQN